MIGFHQNSKKTIFHIWLHTSFIIVIYFTSMQDNYIVFPKNQIDKLHKNQKVYIPNDATLTIILDDL